MQSEEHGMRTHHRGSSSAAANATLSRKRGADTSQDKAERKRKTDKEYRERCKMKDKEKKNKLDALRLYNGHLRNQNDTLLNENINMNETLGCNKEEMKKLKNVFAQLKRKYDLEKVLVEALSEHVAHPYHRHIQFEDKHMKDIIAAAWPNLEEYLLLLKEENEKLKEKRRRYKVKEEALCAKIINDFEKLTEANSDSN
ncbi:hypothetical protein CFOL_v3_12742 [Cephalotus follicularis]|uniref:Uncharacterized protein n=1 Tax=Cephalotus follicularis TaxID=3775 RepID=A0A1Q3BMI5_CEPFO|nr:hypothetical protein CFOL_v3_12742 [Cephalotus follicularis]